MRIQEFISKSYIFAIGHSYDAIWRKFNARLKARGCNMTEALVLVSLYFEENREATPSAIANTLQTSRANISHCLNTLVTKRYITRRLGNEDARRTILGLTTSGLKYAQSLVLEINNVEDLCEKHFKAASSKDLISKLYGLRL